MGFLDQDNEISIRHPVHDELHWSRGQYSELNVEVRMTRTLESDIDSHCCNRIGLGRRGLGMREKVDGRKG